MARKEQAIHGRRGLAANAAAPECRRARRGRRAARGVSRRVTRHRHAPSERAARGHFGPRRSRARDGRFTGYVKPIVKDLDILHVKKEPKSAGEAITGFFAKLMAHIFENKPKQQLATRIDFSGAFDDPQVGVWDAAVNFVQNAFVRALAPGFDESVAPRPAERAKSN